MKTILRINRFTDARTSAGRGYARGIFCKAVFHFIGRRSYGMHLQKGAALSDADLRLAAQKQETYLEAQNGTKQGTVHDLAQKKGINQCWLTP